MPINAPAAEKAVRSLLVALGQNVRSDALKDTPARVARAYVELLAGYEQDPARILCTEFAAEEYDEMIVLRQVPFFSLCEHHLLPFMGSATVAYIPNENRKVVGLSKLARLVECYARRLQLQERMTIQIAHAIRDHLNPLGYGVALRASHLCMCARGVNKPGSEMVTQAVGGLIRKGSKARNEFLRSAGL